MSAERIYRSGNVEIEEDDDGNVVVRNTDTDVEIVVSDSVEIDTAVIEDTVEIGDEFEIVSEEVADIERLVLRALAGGDEEAELALKPTGNASESRIILTDDPNLNNFEAVAIRANDTEMVIESIAEGSGSVLPLRFDMDGQTVFEVTTDGTLALNASLDADGEDITEVGDADAETVTSNELILRDTS